VQRIYPDTTLVNTVMSSAVSDLSGLSGLSDSSRAVRWRVALLGPVDTWFHVRKKLHFSPSSYDAQIHSDVARTQVQDSWFHAQHRASVCQLLNAFASTNPGIGYAQGLNFLVFPLYKVFYLAAPQWAMEDTFYSLQRLMRSLLLIYPLHCDDMAVLTNMVALSADVKLRATTIQPKLCSMLFSEQYAPFLMSLVSKLLPTLFANVFSVDNTIVLWDHLFANDLPLLNLGVHCVARLLVINYNAVLHLPLDKCMVVVQHNMPHTLRQLCASLRLL